MLKGFKDRSLTVKLVEKNFPFSHDIPPDPDFPNDTKKKSFGFSKSLKRDYKLDTDAVLLNEKLREIVLNYLAQKSAVNPLDSRDREKRFGKIFRVTAELAAILDKLSVSESRQLRDVSGAADLVGLKEQLDLVGAAAEQASYSSSKKITQDRKDQAFYTMIWSMSKLLPADAERKTKARFLVECLDRLGLFASELSDNQKYLKIKDLLRKNQKIFGS